MAWGARCHPTWHESAEGTRVSEPWLVEPQCAACTAQVTTSMNPSKYIEEFLAEMVELLPNSEYRKSGTWRTPRPTAAPPRKSLPA